MSTKRSKKSTKPVPKSERSEQGCRRVNVRDEGLTGQKLNVKSISALRADELRLLCKSQVTINVRMTDYEMLLFQTGTKFWVKKPGVITSVLTVNKADTWTLPWISPSSLNITACKHNTAHKQHNAAIQNTNTCLGCNTVCKQCNCGHRMHARPV